MENTTNESVEQTKNEYYCTSYVTITKGEYNKLKHFKIKEIKKYVDKKHSFATEMWSLTTRFVKEMVNQKITYDNDFLLKAFDKLENDILKALDKHFYENNS